MISDFSLPYWVRDALIRCEGHGDIRMYPLAQSKFNLTRNTLLEFDAYYRKKRASGS